MLRSARGWVSAQASQGRAASDVAARRLALSLLRWNSVSKGSTVRTDLEATLSEVVCPDHRRIAQPLRIASVRLAQGAREGKMRLQPRIVLQ
jgi:hypothetical protein